MDNRSLRIGIDVGGTFTHAVAVEQPGNRLVAHAVTPTTHAGSESVSRGIITVFREIMAQTKAEPREVCFVAHSTTQATNALLEGDVAKVGIVGMGKGLEALKAKYDTRIKSLELSPGKFLQTAHVFLNSSTKEFTEEKTADAVLYLKKSGCRVIVASEAFGVDNDVCEKAVSACALENELPAAAACEISQLYGLKVRTRTAVINASILPKMTSTADITDESIKKSGISVPLMIMRSDGGVMDLPQMRRRPILTLLSGPAAGIAAALMFAKVSDGIFLEVGGTSTDISAIKDGKAMIKSAEIGGHITYLKTLDSRTVGIGGGSMVRMQKNKVVEVGPRSAHIAGLSYLAFCDEAEIASVRPEFRRPVHSDPDDYLTAVNENGKIFAVTLTDAAIAAGSVKKGDYAYSNEKAVKNAFEQLAKAFGTDGKTLAEEILDKAISKIIPVVKDLLEEYGLDPDLISLVGGGGGCTVVVPWLSKKLGVKYAITDKAEVISAIGAAIAMLRDSVERTVINPNENDILSIRKEAANRLEAMGADAATVDVQTEFDRTKNILRAVAVGSLHMNKASVELAKSSADNLRANAAASFKADPAELRIAAQTEFLTVFEYRKKTAHFFGLLKNYVSQYRVLDAYGVIKLQVNEGFAMQSRALEAYEAIAQFIDEKVVYTDAGMILPEVFILYKSKIGDYSSILDFNQLKNLIKTELNGLDKDEPVVALIRRRK